ncbi:MAG: tRNA 2-thiouridine(34) synthase MnmA [Massiliimalia sp.]|jgi:tRNA-specific 2-thiouridylase
MIEQQSKKILVALSGGVDSSVCVHLLREQGHQVAGVVLKMSPAHQQTVQDAQEVADALGVTLYVKDMCQEFEKHVVSYFIDEYQHGRTPNPCVVCNPTVKFKALVDAADEYGYDYVATGHYADLITRGDKVLLARGECKKRDQSYMLYRLGQRELQRLIFPLNHMEKDEVRRIAEQAKLPCAKKPDSQEICFIPDHDYAKFIEQRVGISPKGDFISPEGTVCGQHQGLIHYTVGQRKHLGIALGKPVFIREIDPDTNRIYLADAGKDCFSQAVISKVTYPDGVMRTEPFDALVKIRSMAPLTPARIVPMEGDQAKVIFVVPQRAVAKGQSIVCYNPDETVIGGGFVTRAEE